MAVRSCFKLLGRGLYLTFLVALPSFWLTTSITQAQDVFQNVFVEVDTFSLRAEDLKNKGLPGWRFLGTQPEDSKTILAHLDDYAKPDYPDKGQDKFVTSATWVEDWDLVPGDAGPRGRAGDPGGIPDNSNWVQRLHVVIPKEFATKGEKFFLMDFNIDDNNLGTYWNGVRIGSGAGWQVNYKLEVPKNLIKFGEENVITIIGNEGGGGAGHNLDYGGPRLVAAAPGVILSLRAEDLTAAELPGWRFLQTQPEDAETIANNLEEYAKPDYPDQGKDKLIPTATWLEDWPLVPGDAGPLGRAGDPAGIPDNSNWVQRLHIFIPKELEVGTKFILRDFNVDDDNLGTYWNGKLLGSGMGWTRLWIFEIPKDAIKFGAENVLTIIGHEGGGGAGHNLDYGGPNLEVATPAGRPKLTNVPISSKFFREIDFISLRAADLKEAGLPGWRFLGTMPEDAETIAANKDAYAAVDYPDKGKDKFVPSAEWLENWDLVPGDAGPRGRAGEPGGIPDNSNWVQRLHVVIPADFANKGERFFLEDFNVDDNNLGTYWNGVKIGAGGGWTTNWRFLVPKKLIKFGGENVITIVGNEGGGGAGHNIDYGGPRFVARSAVLQPPPTLRVSMRAEDLKKAGLPGWRFLGTQPEDAQTIRDNLTEYAKPDYPDKGADKIIPSAKWIEDWDLVPGDAGPRGRAGEPGGIPDNTAWVQRLHIVIPKEAEKGVRFMFQDFNVDDDTLGIFWNGTLLASGPYWERNWKVKVPKNLIKFGEENVITIIGFEGGGGAGHNLDYGGPHLLVTLPVEAVPPPAPTAVCGDANGDGRVAINDAILALQIAVGTRKATDTQLAALDLNGDGKVTIAEVIPILRKAVNPAFALTGKNCK